MIGYFVSRRCLVLLLGCLISLQHLSHANPSRLSFKQQDLNSIESSSSGGRGVVVNGESGGGRDEHFHQDVNGGFLAAGDGDDDGDDVVDESKEVGLGIVNSAQEMLNSNSVHVVNECVKVVMEEGIFYYKSKGGSDTCGLYFLSDPNKSIVITVNYLDVQCQHGGLISIVDGWEWRGQLFPSASDHEKRLDERFHEFCGRKKIHRSFISSQNAALIQYRIPMFGQGFSVRVQHVVNPRPCNILVQDTEAVYTLQNFGRAINCSLTTIFDAKLHPLFLSAGLHGAQVNSFTSGIHKHIFHKCGKMGLQDYVQLGGSNGIDTANMEVIEEVCGYDPNPSNKITTIFCGMTTVRLVSSGSYQNKVIVEVQRAGIEDIENANYICDL